MVSALTLVALVVAAGPELQLPWKCGQVEACTQGHDGGSHTGASKWAWDFVLSEGEEIWSTSAGTVTHMAMSSNVGGCSSAYIYDANYITIDHGDGTSIIYAHMQTKSSPLKVGDEVEVGDLIGRVGQTGYSCGAHLHMAVQEGCGSSHCNSVHGSFAGVGDPAAGQSYESDNCPVCSKTLDGGTTVIDDQHAGCLVRKTKAWESALNGHGGHHFYTLATDAADDHTRASWIFGVDVPGIYAVEVFIPDKSAGTTAARYEVHHADGTAEVVIDQSADKGWQPLGEYPFEGSDGERIYLGDATGENLETLGRRIAYDAVRFSYVGPLPVEPDVDPPLPPDDDAGDGTTTADAPTVDGDAALDGTTTASDGLPPWSGEDATAGGCRIGGAPSRAAWWLIALAGLAVRRRRDD